MRLLLYDADHTGAEIRLFCKSEDGRTMAVIDKKFPPYFYILPSDGKLDEVKEKLLSMEKVSDVKVVDKILLGERKKFLQVFTSDPSDVPKVREDVKSWKEKGLTEGEFEYGISFYKRYIIDKGLDPMGWIEVSGKRIESDWNFEIIETSDVKPSEGKEVELKVLAFDIETYEDSGETKVIMLSLYGDGIKRVITYQKDDYPEYVEVVESEPELIRRFLELVKEYDPDVILTYNGDDFDFKILRERSEKHRIPLILSRDGSAMRFDRRARTSSARLGGRLHIDLYRFISNILSDKLQTEILTLGEVAREILGEEKIDMTLEEIYESWRSKEMRGLAEYCLRDSELTYRLGEVLLSQIFALSKVSGQLPFDSSRMTYGQLVEWYLVRKAYPKMVSPPRPKWEDVEKRRRATPYKGGFVREPKPGIHENIAVLDFKSLYPSIIVTYNIDPGTLNKDCKKVHKVPGHPYHFCADVEGFIPSILLDLIERRSKIKKEMKRVKDKKLLQEMDSRQYALKILANATYGYFGYAGARWYSRECAESITAFGREWIQRVMSEAEKDGFEIIYGDTDSLMIKNGDPKKFMKRMNEMLPGIMELELEGVYKRGLFVSREGGKGAKKRYALIDDEGNITIRGFETVRRDWCELAKKVQRKCLYYILAENDVDRAVRYVNEMIEKTRRREVDFKDLIIYTQITRDLMKYERKGPHVIVAEKLKRMGRYVGEGSVIMYVITKGKGSISERAEPFDAVSLEDIDTEYYIENQIIPAALRVLSTLGVDGRSLKGKGYQRSLTGFAGD